MPRQYPTLFIVLFQALFTVHRCFTASSIKKENQELKCDIGQALSNIQWTQVDKSYRTFRIDCIVIPDVTCDDGCVWSTSCLTSKYGSSLYTRGVKVLYDALNDKQPYILFLCCNTTVGVQKKRKCDATMQSRKGSTKTNNLSYVRQANSSFANGTIYLDTCSIDNEQPKIVCRTRDDRPQFDKRLYGLAGLAGLAGLSGLALLKKPREKTCQEKIAQILPDIDVGFATAAPFDLVESTTVEACCSYCLTGKYTACNFFPYPTFKPTDTCVMETNTGVKQLNTKLPGVILFLP